MTDRGLALGLTALAAVVVGGIVHIAAVLIMPFVAPDDAYARVTGYSSPGLVKILPQPFATGDPLPGRDPSVASAVCSYDLAGGPVRISADIGEAAFMALSLHSRAGLAYFGLNDRAGNDGRLEVVVMTVDQQQQAVAREGTERMIRDVRVVAPELRGFAQVDALPRIGGYDRARLALASVGCKIERDP